MRVGPAQHDPIRGLDSIHSVAIQQDDNASSQPSRSWRQLLLIQLKSPMISERMTDRFRRLLWFLPGWEGWIQASTSDWHETAEGGIVSESDALNGPTCAAALTCLPPISLNLPNHQAPTRGRCSIPASTVSVESPTSGFTNERPLFLASFGS